ncbi:hypothetical protein [Arthrobacter sp. AZCC_0090]|uniref:hypothetical protein n=1 Tax=Arthrobacter sp. AZCC_0090 TaxID=2735881 RepID=UPI0017F0AF96|nr:hypothetical protein [Arthrobacter sp. AZCC_0090]MBB6406381.1 hypothetical protein [Arthrobacter sp. AZCC_0090]
MSSYFEIEDALQVINRYGFHIRDIGLLASALERPATTVMGPEGVGKVVMVRSLPVRDPGASSASP